MALKETVEALQRLPIEEAQAILTAFERKRKQEKFIFYWQAQSQQLDVFTKFSQGIKTFGVLGGNRSGKTDLGAFLTVAWALGKEAFKGEPAWEYVKDLPIPEPPNNIWVVGLDFHMIRDVIWREKLLEGRQHAAFIPEDALDRDPNETDFQIFFANGSTITCKSAESGPTKFQSASVDFIWIDEEPEAAIYNECYQRTADCAGKILITLTPLVDIASGVREPWVHDLYREWKQGKKDVHFMQLSVLDNPYVPDVEKENLKAKWAGHPEERARLYGDFIQKSGLVYPNWKRGLHTCKRFPIPLDWPSIASIDPAATGPTACIWGRVDSHNNLYLTKNYKKSNLVVSEHAKNILVRNGTEPVDIWLIDPKWGAQREAQTHKSGAQLYKDAGIPVRLAEVDSDYGLNASREYVNATLDATNRHPKLFVFDDLHEFFEEIEGYTWATFERGEMKGLSKEKPVKRHDHLCNAFQYMCAMKPKGRASRAAILTNIERARQAAVNSYTQ